MNLVIEDLTEEKDIQNNFISHPTELMLDINL